MIKIDDVKEIVQNGTKHYIVGIKFVTYESAENVLQSIKKDLMIYKDIVQFVVNDNFIEVILSSNATLCIYYFTDSEVFDEVVKELPKFDIRIVNVNKLW